METEHIQPKDRFARLSPVLSHESPFFPNENLSEELPEAFYKMDVKVLVVGAGGLGCQILKNLALSGIKELHVIDLDTIDLTNLNRQFLFRKDDIGKGKAQVAANFIMKRVPTVKVVPYNCKVQEKPMSFYRQFGVIVAGLDNVEARRWLNKMVHDLCQFDDDGNLVEGTQHFLIDGGTENFSGQCMVIKPFETSCYECIVSLIPKIRTFNSCTLASKPRIPEHCIQYVYEKQWQKAFPTRKVDTDSVQDIKWLTEKAKERGNQFNIKGIDEMMTLGVIKNIIPAIASTNALIAAASTNQVLKLILGIGPSLNNYYYYKGMTSIGSETYEMHRVQNCSICSNRPIVVKVPRSTLLSDIVKRIADGRETQSCSIQTNDGSLINPLISDTQQHLEKSIHQLIEEKEYEEGQRLYVSGAEKNGGKWNRVVLLKLQ